MATLSSIRAWEIPWTEEPGELQSMGCKGIIHDLATKQQPGCGTRPAGRALAYLQFPALRNLNTESQNMFCLDVSMSCISNRQQ